MTLWPPPELPGKTYYRAGGLGAGACGSVVCCYDDDGNESAAKIFPFWNADGEECEENEVGLDRCVLREVSGACPTCTRSATACRTTARSTNGYHAQACRLLPTLTRLPHVRLPHRANIHHSPPARRRSRCCGCSTAATRT